MIWSTEEIVRSYRMAADPKKQIKVLAELNACSVKEIRQVLVGEGALPRETEVPEEPKTTGNPELDKMVSEGQKALTRRSRRGFMRRVWTMRPSRRRQAQRRTRSPNGAAGTDCGRK